MRSLATASSGALRAWARVRARLRERLIAFAPGGVWGIVTNGFLQRGVASGPNSSRMRLARSI